LKLGLSFHGLPVHQPEEAFAFERPYHQGIIKLLFRLKNADNVDAPSSTPMLHKPLLLPLLHVTIVSRTLNNASRIHQDT
jgi:hypothetical protein